MFASFLSVKYIPDDVIGDITKECVGEFAKRLRRQQNIVLEGDAGVFLRDLEFLRRNISSLLERLRAEAEMRERMAAEQREKTAKEKGAEGAPEKVEAVKTPVSSGAIKGA